MASLRLRLFAFFFLFLVAVMSGVLIIMLISGVFQAGIRGTRSLLENELEHISQDVYQDFGNISVYGLILPRGFQKPEKQFAEHGFTADQLQSHPNCGRISEKELSQLTNALKNQKGAFNFRRHCQCGTE